jgi:hypothetical protein
MFEASEPSDTFGLAITIVATAIIASKPTAISELPP